VDFKPGFRDFNDFCVGWTILEEIFGHFRFLAKANCYSSFGPSAKADGNKMQTNFIAVSFSLMSFS